MALFLSLVIFITSANIIGIHIFNLTIGGLIVLNVCSILAWQFLVILYWAITKE
jgi:hypothetical protein